MNGIRPKDCPSFPGCSAPLCPLDAQSLERGVWFPNEAICHKERRHERWIVMQKRIARQTGDPKRGYFTVAMLDALTVVGRAIKGIDPSVDNPAPAEAAWIARKRRQGLSPEEIERRRQRAIACGLGANHRGRGKSDTEKAPPARAEAAPADKTGESL